MSSELFSQSDIDALLGGNLAAAPAPKAAAQAKPKVDAQLYDFRRPHRVSKDKLRALEAMYERMAKSLESWLIGRLRGQVEVNLQGVEQISFGEFVLSLANPCASYLVDIGGLAGQQGVIDIGLDFAYYVVDRLFGGQGDPVDLSRALSTIEKKAVWMVADRIRALLADTWRDNVPLDLMLSGFESVPEILQAGNREDPMLIANFEVRTGAVTGLVGVCMPFVALEKFFSSQGSRRIKNPAGAGREGEVARQLTEGLIRETPVPVSARLPEFKLAMREIAALQVGSVISTGVPSTTEIDVWVGDERRLRALPGRSGKMLALQVLHSLAGPDVRGEKSITEESNGGH